VFVLVLNLFSKLCFVLEVFFNFFHDLSVNWITLVKPFKTINCTGMLVLIFSFNRR